jgi:hypothetical protein
VKYVITGLVCYGLGWATPWLWAHRPFFKQAVATVETDLKKFTK